MEEYYSLDNDSDFTNCTNITNDVYVYINILKKICYRNDFHTLLNKQDFVFSAFKYKKGFIRIELPNNEYLTQIRALTAVMNLNIKLSTKEGDMIKIQFNMAFNICLMKQLGKSIEVIDTELFLQQHTEEEINSLIYHKVNGEQVFNSKYIFDNNKTFYLDIPLFDEFYLNDEFTGDKYMNIFFEGLMEENYKFSIQFEETIVKNYKIANNSTDKMVILELVSFYTTTCRTYSIYNDTSTFSVKISYCEFIFIVLYREEFDTVLLQNVALNLCILDDNGIGYIIEPSNISMIDYGNIITYGISPNINTNMNSLNMNENKYENQDYLNKITLTFDKVNNPIYAKIIYVHTLKKYIDID
jgi:hypothetical protein